MYRVPNIVDDWIKRKPPKCCFTCEHFLSFDATCIKFNQVVPEHFAQEIGACPEWQEIKIPF